MKRLIVFLIAVTFIPASYGQLSMKIDSIDISPGGEIVIRPGIHISYPGESPRIQIITTINNNTSDAVILYYPSAWSCSILAWCYRGQRFEKYIPWSCPIAWEPEDSAYRGDFEEAYPCVVIRPYTSKKFIFRTLLPMNRKKELAELKDIPLPLEVYETHPVWTWEGDNPSDREYLQWVKEILDSIKIRVRSNYDSFLESSPIDLQKVVVTTNIIE